MPTRNVRDFAATMQHARRQAGAFIVDNFFRSAARLGKLHPRAKPEKHRVEVIPNVPYLDDGNVDHLLDVYRPTDVSGPLPVVLYIHGGGFRILSKDTHWVMGLAFARRGFLVFNINYRLGPKNPFPAAIEDACNALLWVAEHAKEYGGDLSRLIIAGESAGANLATALTVATSYERPEPWARAVFQRGVRPVAAMPACGILQVSDTERFRRRRPKLSSLVADRLHEVTDAYLGGAKPDPAGGTELADPLCILESDAKPARPLPPFFTAVGTRDPLLDDTRRLKTALDRKGVHCKVVYYPGEMHAFHALVFRPNALDFWRQSYQFLDECLAPLAVQAEHAAK